MKDEILSLRQQGLSYRAIQAALNCSKSTIAYHCGKGQKQKTADRTATRRAVGSGLCQQIERFKGKGLRSKCASFQRTGPLGNRGDGSRVSCKGGFKEVDVLQKIGPIPVCYLTGTPIDLTQKGSFNFDHIIPPNKGGDNSLANLGLTTKQANMMKHDLTPSELFELCKKALEYNGYSVTKL